MRDHPARSRREKRVPTPDGSRFTRLGSQSGSALLLTILILGILSMLGTTIVMNSMGERQVSAYHWEKTQALAAAETGVAFATRLIQDMSAPLEDSDGDGKPDFALADTLASGGSYRVIAEASDVGPLDSSAYRAAAFTVVAEGQRGNALRRVTVKLIHDSFLKFARFVALGSSPFECGTVVGGEVYMQGDLVLPTGCAEHPVEFLEAVYVQSGVQNPESAIFHRGCFTNVNPIDLQNSVSMSSLRDCARGLLSLPDADGDGAVGIYCDLGTGTFPFMPTAAELGGPVSTPALTELDLGLFDFVDMTTAPGETLVTYSGYRLVNALSGEVLRSSEFNGLIFCEGDAPIKGVLDGKSGRCLTLAASDEIVIRGDIIAGHTGFDVATQAATGTGDPVNLALIAENDIAVAATAPRILRVDAALLSRSGGWRCDGTIAEHPPVAAVALDLDLDGVTGETPCNNDPYVGVGWDERVITEYTWVLNFTGPLITYTSGMSGAWVNTLVTAAASGPTRRRNYDLDFQIYHPPYFPRPVNLWKEQSWSEIRDCERDLAAFLPC